MSLSLQLVIRLLTAALLGAAIGYEREFRAKNAGVRTHILVALGSALFMIISQFGFPEDARFDAARVAAGVVTGIGFIGGGIIMKKKHVSGLTTAASLWVTGAVGLSAGSGMFEVSILCTILVLLCLEALNLYSFKLGRNEVTAVLSSLEMCHPGAGRGCGDFLALPSGGALSGGNLSQCLEAGEHARPADPLVLLPRRPGRESGMKINTLKR